MSSMTPCAQHGRRLLYGVGSNRSARHVRPKTAYRAEPRPALLIRGTATRRSLLQTGVAVTAVLAAQGGLRPS
jgi:hypothetical protein